MTHPKIAFFDFDGTITRHDTFISFAKYALGAPRFYLKLLLSAPWLAAWKGGLISNSAAKQRLFTNLFRGMPGSRFNELCRAFAIVIDRDLRPDTMRRLNAHIEAGHYVAIVSASPAAWILPWAQSHGVNEVIATGIETDPVSNCLTGRFSTPNCHGAEKVTRIRARFPNFDQAETWAYGDSSGDDCMLSAATHAEKLSN